MASTKFICQFKNLAGKACTYAVCGETPLTATGESQGVPFYISKAGKKMTGSIKFCNRHKKHEQWWPRCSWCHQYKVDSDASGKTQGTCSDCIEAGAHLPREVIDPVLNISTVGHSPESGWATVAGRNAKKEFTATIPQESSESVKAARALLAAALAAESAAATAKHAEAHLKAAAAKKNLDNRATARQYAAAATDEQIRALIEFIEYIPPPRLLCEQQPVKTPGQVPAKEAKLITAKAAKKAAKQDKADGWETANYTERRSEKKQ